MPSNGQASNGTTNDKYLIDKIDDHDMSNGPLFYAYARRTDSHWASRYLLTFASASVANEWWTLAQREYPNSGIRTSPQFFSFDGDKFPEKLAKSNNFEHLKTKWFYTQIGDSDGTGGRNQGIIPLQDAEGRMLSGGGEDESKIGDGAEADEAAESSFMEGLRRLQEVMEANGTQIKALAEAQAKSQERTEQMEKMVEENATSIKKLAQAQSAIRKQMKEIAEQSKEQLQSLTEGQVSSAEQLQQALEQNATASAEMTKELKRLRRNAAAKPATQSEIKCTHNVRPPPRKLDKVIVGYDYGNQSID